MSEGRKHLSDATTRIILFVINNAPYGDERPFNALRLALNLVKRPGVTVRVFLTGDGVNCARRGQKTPAGYYNVERMVKALARRGEVAT
jgi:uncharacterized protein involved in oxidation of intracellular sulfur